MSVGNRGCFPDNWRLDSPFDQPICTSHHMLAAPLAAEVKSKPDPSRRSTGFLRTFDWVQLCTHEKWQCHLGVSQIEAKLLLRFLACSINRKSNESRLQDGEGDAIWEIRFACTEWLCSSPRVIRLVPLYCFSIEQSSIRCLTNASFALERQ